MNSGELKGGGGIFKFGLRQCDTVCIGSRDSFAEKLGGGCRCRQNLTFVRPCPYLNIV